MRRTTGGTDRGRNLENDAPESFQTNWKNELKVHPKNDAGTSKNIIEIYKKNSDVGSHVGAICLALHAVAPFVCDQFFGTVRGVAPGPILASPGAPLIWFVSHLVWVEEQSYSKCKSPLGIISILRDQMALTAPSKKRPRFQKNILIINPHTSFLAFCF